MKKSNKKFSIGMLIFNILSLIIVLFAIYWLIIWNIENHKNQQLQESLISNTDIITDVTTINNTKVENIRVDLSSLQTQNSDTVRMAQSQ